MIDTPRVAITLEQSWHRVPGGTAVATLGLCRSLAPRADVEVVGVAARHRRPPSSEWEAPVELCHLGLPRLLLYESWHRLRRPPVQRATGAVDVIHATTLAIPPKSAPLVVTVHDLAFLDNPSHFTKRGMRLFSRGLELAIEDADLVLCPSQATRAACEAAGFSSGKIRVVPHGIDAAPVSDERIAAAKAAYSLERPYVLWTGTVEPRKNLPRVVGAFKQLESGCDLVLAGPQGWNEDLDALVGGLGSRIKWIGFVGQNDLPALYAGARAFCWPSLLEGFGLPVLEAMAQGTPVVTSSGTSMAEVANGAALLVDPRSVDSIAEGLDRVLRDEALARTLAQAGRARARQYSWDRAAELTVAAYKEVA
jgi:glycosyltransferase involved in cell wall biosynthesis